MEARNNGTDEPTCTADKRTNIGGGGARGTDPETDTYTP